MGGKALKTAYTERCDDDKYKRLSKELVEILDNVLDNVHVVKNYTSKKTHGDIDIICGTMVDINYNDLINTLFKPNEIFHNGNCYSFDYDKTQIDLITCSNDDYDAYSHYYDYGLGNYLGKIAQSIGLKYGSEGLWYNYYLGSNEKHKIIVSTDFRKIYTLLGYNYDIFLNGFKDIEDIYDYVTTSKYFTPRIFKIENLSRINRGRDARRKSYMGFLKYIKRYTDNVKYDYDKTLALRLDPIKTINSNFPEANIDLELMKYDYLHYRRKYIRAKFNGKHIIKKYGFKGKKLGSVMGNFKNYIKIIYDELSYEDVILKCDIDYIYNLFEQSLHENFDD